MSFYPLSVVRSKMEMLMGEHASFPVLTTTQKNDILYEATMSVTTAIHGYPAHISSTFPGNAKSSFLALVDAGYGAVSCMRDIISIHEGATTSGPPLEWLPLTQLTDLQNRVGDAGTPTRWSAYSTDVNAEQGRLWTLLLYPIPISTFTLSLVAYIMPPRLASDSDVFRLPWEDVALVIRIGAAIGAEVAGRSQGLIDELWSGVPATMRGKVNMAGFTPRVRQMA